MRMIISICALAFLTAGFTAMAQSGDGPVAHWKFDEGTGDVLHDRSANGNDGKIHNAQWIKAPNGAGLRFGRKDSYVDFGDNPRLKLAKDMSFIAWLTLEHFPDYDTNWTIVSCENYNEGGFLLRLDGNSGTFLFRASQKGSNQYASSVAGLLNKRKYLVAFTRNGPQVNFYVNGISAGTYRHGLPAGKSAVDDPIVPANPFRISDASQSFGGVIEDLRAYDRALTAGEIADLYRREGAARGEDMSIFRKIGLQAHVHPQPGKVIAWLDATRLMPLPKGARVVVELARSDEPAALARIEIKEIPASGKMKAVLDALKLKPGGYTARVELIGADGKIIGERNSAPVQWPGQPEEFKKIKILNNLCWELLNVRAVDGKRKFTLPCDRWVFIRTEAKIENGGAAWVGVDSDARDQAAIVHSTAGESTLEAMRFLKAGSHAIHAGRKGKAEISRLVLRAIPMLQYASSFDPPHIKEHGPYDWDFLKKDVLPNINTMISDAAGMPPHLDEWKAMGRKWITMRNVPWKQAKETNALDKVCDHWTGAPGLADQRLDGIIIDEFAGGHNPGFDVFRQAVERIFAKPEFKGKLFLPYGGPFYGGNRSTEFARACARFGGGYLCAWEVYLGEQASVELAKERLENEVVAEMMPWEESFPGAASQLVVVYGFMSQPPENLNNNPKTDYRVWRDMQMRLLADDPVFFGLGGIQMYHSSYCDEENLRLTGRLYRHYAIEGNTEPLISDPFNLAHVQNPDFQDSTAGWTISPAEAGSIQPKSHPGYGWLQGRYPRQDSFMGDNFLWMKRSAEKPNTASQEIKNLQPGRLYSMKMISADYQDLVKERSNKDSPAANISLDGVEILPGSKNSFQSTFNNCYAHHLGKFDNTLKFYMNYHWRVFRAKSTTALLTVSDWAGQGKPAEAGAPAKADQELMINFVEIQPYIGE